MAHSPDAFPVDKLESFLVCSICLETLKDPRTLPCFHSYCRSCLEKFVKSHLAKPLFGRQETEFNCPTCRNQFTLNPDDKVADMTTSDFIRNMLEVMAVGQHRIKSVPCSHCQGASVGRCVTCEVFLCQECLADHNKYRGFVNHSVLSMDELSKPENEAKIRGKLYCHEHKTKALKFYCETCSQLICRYCMDFNHGKANHACFLIEHVAHKEKQSLTENCNTLETKLKQGNVTLEEISNVLKSLEKVKAQMKRNINRRKDAILKAVTQQLNKKADSLFRQVDEEYTRKYATLSQQREEARTYIEKLESCVGVLKGLLVKGTDYDILSSAKMMRVNIGNTQKKRLKTRIIPPNYATIFYPVWFSLDNRKILALNEEMGEITVVRNSLDSDNEKAAKVFMDSEEDEKQVDETVENDEEEENEEDEERKEEREEGRQDEEEGEEEEEELWVVEKDERNKWKQTRGNKQEEWRAKKEERKTRKEQRQEKESGRKGWEDNNSMVYGRSKKEDGDEEEEEEEEELWVEEEEEEQKNWKQTRGKKQEEWRVKKEERKTRKEQRQEKKSGRRGWKDNNRMVHGRRN